MENIESDLKKALPQSVLEIENEIEKRLGDREEGEGEAPFTRRARYRETTMCLSAEEDRDALSRRVFFFTCFSKRSSRVEKSSARLFFREKKEREKTLGGFFSLSLSLRKERKWRKRARVEKRRAENDPSRTRFLENTDTIPRQPADVDHLSLPKAPPSRAQTDTPFFATTECVRVRQDFWTRPQLA